MIGSNGRQEIERRKERWVRFLDMEQPPSHVFMITYDPDSPKRPPLWPTLKQERIDWAWQMYERQMERLAWLRDDMLPYLAPATGTEIFAEAFGCPVHRPEDGNPFALPLIHEADEVSALRVPDVGSTPLVLLFEIADELRRRAGPEALLQLVDIQSPMDIAALIWQKERFYLALQDAPEAIAELAAKVQQLLTAFLDEWFRRYGREFIAHYPSYYMPKGLTLSEDEVGSVSPGMFERLFLPELVRLSERYDGLGMHCCAHARRQWPGFLRIPNLRLLNLVQPEAVLRDAWRFFTLHVPQMHSWSGDGPAWTWPRQYPEGSRIVLQPKADTREEALEIAERVGAAIGRG